LYLCLQAVKTLSFLEYDVSKGNISNNHNNNHHNDCYDPLSLSVFLCRFNSNLLHNSFSRMDHPVVNRTSRSSNTAIFHHFKNNIIRQEQE